MADGAFDDLDMAAARAKFAAKVDGRRVARKSRQKKTADDSKEEHEATHRCRRLRA